MIENFKNHKTKENRASEIKLMTGIDSFTFSIRLQLFPCTELIVHTHNNIMRISCETGRRFEPANRSKRS